MDSLFLAIIIGLAIWLFMRRAQMAKQRKRYQQQIATGEIEEPKTMPRVGQPGTVTREQLQQLKDNDFEPSRLWSAEEAQLILDALMYGRAVIREETGDSSAPLEVQNAVLSHILSDEELRDYILDWRRNLTREEEDNFELPDTEQIEAVREFVRGQWEDEG